MNETALSFDHVNFSYDHSRMVISDLSLDIPSGSITALLGPNGGGKSTLLHLALGWLKPERGQIILDGQCLKAYDRRQLGKCIGLVPQAEHISFDFSLREFVLLGRAPHLKPLDMPTDEDMLVVEDALKEVGLLKIAHRSVLTLSGGERQLLLVARVIAQQPRIYLMDEPSSHLDLGNKVRLSHLLKEINALGVTILLTTHEPDLASVLANHLILIKNGQIQDVGDLDKVMTADKLSSLYGIPLNVVRVDGRNSVMWS